MTIAFTVIVLSAVALISAGLLFVVAKRFEVKEDPRIAQIGDVLPQANCGGCGYPGCSGFAGACVKASSLEGLFCPVGGAAVMDKVATIMGFVAEKSDPKVAVVRCNGTCEARPRTNHYDGAKSCRIAANLYGGETGCSYGCLGLGDCVSVCNFGALHMDPETGLPVVDEEKCTACGACVKACPKIIIELRKKGPKGRRIFVSCVNKEKGGVAKKACSNACIGCSLCYKACAFEAITIENNLSYIDYNKCRMCRKCVEACPTKAIHEVNFPPRPPKSAEGEKKTTPRSMPQNETQEKEQATPQGSAQLSVPTTGAVHKEGVKTKPEQAPTATASQLPTEKKETVNKEKAEVTVPPTETIDKAPASVEKQPEA